MADIIVCSRLPQDIVLEVGTGDDKKTFLVKGSKHEVYANGGEKNSFLGAMAMTNVDETLFSAWLEANKDSKLVANSMIFSSSDTRSAKSKKKELEKESTGLEGLNQNGDKRAGGGKLTKD